MAVNIVTGMTGIEHITSHDDRARNASQFGRGKYVFDVGNKFSASIIDDNLVRIQDGMCINQGTQMGIEPNDYADVEIDNGLLGTNRHDIIVMRYEKNEETLLEKASLVVVKGVNSSEPVDPDITEGNILDGGDLVDDMPLYRVVIEGVNLVSVEPLFEVFDGDVGSILEELEDKVDKVTGKGLSTNDYTNEDKTKLNNIETGAEVNVQADWSQTDNSQDDFIKNKPSIPSKTSDLQNDSDFVSDADYVHTDNNYTNANKEDVAKIEDLEHSLSTTKTATGNPISVSDSAHVNAEELVVTLEPIQSGSGDPSPENIRPISGYDETSVVIKDTAENPTVTDTYTLQFGDTIYGAEVDFVSGVATVDRGFVEYDGSSDENWYRYGVGSSSAFAMQIVQDNVKGPILPGNLEQIKTNYLQCRITAEIWGNYDYWVSTDVNGGKIITGIKSITTIEDWKAFLALNPLQVCYELASPQTIQLTPQQIKMLKGNNVLVADGDMNLTYQVDSVVGDVKEWAEEHFVPYNTYRIPPVYGFHIDGNNSDPSSRVTYIADNANYTPAYMDYTANKFRYNSWQDAWFIKYCKPCILNQDGTVKAYLNPNDYTKDVDGNTVVIDENLANANVMIEFPEIWYKGVPDAGDVTGASIYFSPVKVDEDYKDYAYIDKDGVHKEHFYMPAYNGSVLSGTTS